MTKSIKSTLLPGLVLLSRNTYLKRKKNKLILLHDIKYKKYTIISTFFLQLLLNILSSDISLLTNKSKNKCERFLY